MDCIPVVPGTPEPKPQPGLYATSSEALKKVCSEYEYWSGKLTETSLQMCYAIIGADWVVFGSINGVMGNNWAKFSLYMVILALASNIVGAWLLSEQLRKRIAYGESNNQRWEREFAECSTTFSPWPFTDRIESVGRTMRLIKGAFTIVAGALLIIGAILK